MVQCVAQVELLKLGIRSDGRCWKVVPGRVTVNFSLFPRIPTSQHSPSQLDKVMILYFFW